MNFNIEKKLAARLAKTLASMCVRNTELEDIHAGKYPTTKTGDYSDVKVIDANGREIPWNELSRISDDEMKMLMKRIVNRIYTYFIQGDDSRFQAQASFYERLTQKWDDPEPEIDAKLDTSKTMVKAVE
jgi:hypothetical protein